MFKSLKSHLFLKCININFHAMQRNIVAEKLHMSIKTFCLISCLCICRFNVCYYQCNNIHYFHVMNIPDIDMCPIFSFLTGGIQNIMFIFLK